jgi:uncharacterized protein
MRLVALAVAAVLLAGCGANTEDVGQHSSTPAAVPAVSSVPSSAVVQQDACVGAAVPHLVCTDPQLTALDQRLAGLGGPRGDWPSVRDACATKPDVRQCVLEAYQTQLADLQIPNAVAATTAHYACAAADKPVSAAFYPSVDPPAMTLTWGEDSVTLVQQPTASGISYSGEGSSYQEHQGAVAVDFRGNVFACTPG